MANAKLKAPKGMTSVSIGGEEFEVVRGMVSVPVEAIPDLIGHGFVGVQDETEVDPSLPAGITQDLNPTVEEIQETVSEEEQKPVEEIQEQATE